MSLSWMRISVFDSAVAAYFSIRLLEAEVLHSTFPSLHDEWYALPSCVFHIGYAGAKRRASGLLGYSLVISVTWFFPVLGFCVLAKQGILQLKRWHKSEDTSLDLC